MWAHKRLASRIRNVRCVVLSARLGTPRAKPLPALEDTLKDGSCEGTQPLQPISEAVMDNRPGGTARPAPPSGGEFADLYEKCQKALLHANARKVEGVSLYFPHRQALVDCAHLSSGKGTSDAPSSERMHPMTGVEDFMWKERRRLSTGELLGAYSKLSKARLTTLVVITAAGGYAMAPAAFDPATFLLASLGTTFMSCSANAINQFFEVPYDAQMNRTKDRVIVRGDISPLHAVAFAAVCGTVGFATLYAGVNTLTALLGLANLLLYTLAYTPVKRLSVVNTWVGSFVGAIPPMMGWAACTGSLDVGAIWLAAVLYSWQFPHFNALSWNLRADYSRAGYRMMCVTEPALCRRVALRHSVAITALCLLAPALDVTTWMFAVDSLPLNGYLVYLAWRFYRKADSSSSRKLFRFSLVHIPALMVLMLIGKKRSEPSAAAVGSSDTEPSPEVASGAAAMPAARPLGLAEEPSR